MYRAHHVKTKKHVEVCFCHILAPEGPLRAGTSRGLRNGSETLLTIGQSGPSQFARVDASQVSGNSKLGWMAEIGVWLFLVQDQCVLHSFFCLVNRSTVAVYFQTSAEQNRDRTGIEPGTRDDSPGATIFSDHTFSTTFRGSIVVSIPACHAGDPGSIPGLGAFFDIPVFQLPPDASWSN